MTAPDTIPWHAPATLVGYGDADFSHTLLDCVRIWRALAQGDQSVGLVNISQAVFGKNILTAGDLAHLAQHPEFLPR